jgi:hypothetical protein
MNLITTFLATAVVIFAFGQAIAANAPKADMAVATAPAAGTAHQGVPRPDGSTGSP